VFDRSIWQDNALEPKLLVAMSQHIRFGTAKDGLKLAYAVSGKGPPLVMSATWLTHLDYQWRSLAWRPWLDAFSRGRKLSPYDARGCGLSDRDTSDFSFDNWVSDFERVIDAAGFGRFDLLGTCWGGPIAIRAMPHGIPSGSIALSFTAPTRLGDCVGTSYIERLRRPRWRNGQL
jgi:hypothetical protein